MADDKIKAREELEAELKAIDLQIKSLKEEIDNLGEKVAAAKVRTLISLYDDRSTLLKEIKKVDDYSKYEELYNQVNHSNNADLIQLQKLLILRANTLTNEYPRLKKELATKIENNYYKDIADIINDEDIKPLTDEADIKRIINKVSTDIVNDLLAIEKIGQTKIPEAIIQPRDKISQKIATRDIIPNGEIVLVETKNNGKVGSKVKMINNNTTAIASQPLTYYDIAVSNAIASLYQAENRYVSYQTLYKTLTGNKSARPTHAIRKEMERSLIKLSTTLLYIDPSGEVDMYHSLAGYKPKYRNMIYIEQDVEVNHRNEITNDWIKILSLPVLSEYAMAKNHISTIELPVFNPPLSRNIDNIALVYYLVNQIERMRNTPTLSRNIRIDKAIDQTTDFTVCKSEGAIKNKKSRMFTTMTDTLDYWKEINYIKDYSINLSKSDKRKKQSVTIILKNSNKSIG